jgi:hypothetical protein
MGSLGGYLEDELLDHVFGKGSYPSPVVYVALSTEDPLDDGSGLAEPSGTGYARAQTSGADWNLSSGGSIDNINEITFNEAAGNWGTITHFALMDAASGGNLLVHGALSQSIPVSSGDTPKFAAGDLDVSLD